VIEVVARGVPAGLGAPIYGKLDTDLAAAMMSINAVKGVEIGDGMAAAALTGSANADEITMGGRPGLHARTTRAASSAGSPPGRRSSCASRSSRPPRS
jgi:chorismate synthase